ncbi:uncharacterized protein [Littorina saxatilis]|uniref:uncharacterized protein isoform X1 n=1 Tax=Littorina saxatilis TaxID=31220 RepID=UPI0038B6A9E7
MYASPCVFISGYRFMFPNIPSSRVISATDGSTVVVPFKLDRGTCPEGWNQTVHVHVLRPPDQNALHGDFCAVSLEGKTCASINEENCACVRGTFGDVGVNFTKSVSTADSGSWVWRTSDGLTTEITFDVREDTSRDWKEPELTSPRNEHQGKTELSLQDSSYEATSTRPSTLRKGVGEGKTTRSSVSSTDVDVTFMDDSVKTGLTFCGMNVVIIITVALVVYLCRKRRAGQVKAHYSVNVTPVIEVNDDVINWRQRHESPNDAERSTSYVSFGGIMTWSNEDLPQAYRNGGRLSGDITQRPEHPAPLSSA